MEVLAVALWRASAVPPGACHDAVVHEWAPAALADPAVAGLTVSLAHADQGAWAAARGAGGRDEHLDAFLVVSLGDAHDLDTLPARDVLHHCARRVEVWRVDTREPKPPGEPAVTGTARPGVKLVTLLRRRAGTTHAGFVRHWTERHTPLALAHHPGLWALRQHVVRRAYTPGGDGVDGIAELLFRDRDDLVERLYDSDDAHEELRADFARFCEPAGPDRTLMTELPLLA